MKNITLSAPEELIELARRKAASKGTTLNSEFRVWLASQAANGEEQFAEYKKLIKQLSHVNAGRKFTRDEMNQR